MKFLEWEKYSNYGSLFSKKEKIRVSTTMGCRLCPKETNKQNYSHVLASQTTPVNTQNGGQDLVKTS